MIHYTTRCTNDDLYAAFQGTDLFANLLSTVNRKDFDTVGVFCQIV